MPILELCKRRLKEGISASSPSLLEILPKVREALGIDCVFQASIEEPAIFFILCVWPSMAEHDAFLASPEKLSMLTPFDQLCDFEWVEFMEFSSMKALPIEAPIMTVTRAFLKSGNHPKEYYRKISELKAPIEEETKPWPCVFSWTDDTKGEVERKKWLMFVGWRSKKHHQDYAAMLRRTNEEFPGIPEHYDEGTMHSHTINMEKPVWVG
ncbi:hypothetical protein B0J14DRAFT_642255 [Halenospora varia]|nr:hypothetical protein B0J14DRAFT_642255 [Halenospora varia]